MFKIRFAIFLTMALSPLLLSTVAAADEGQYVILNAQYGNESNHVDVTDRLKAVARRNRPFRVNHDTMAADPAHGQAKMLRVFARGPDGRERFFDYPDGAGFDPAQFRGWGRGDWGDERWSGGWNGRNDNDHDAGEYLILTARYGNEHRQVDVTNRLKELARQDRVFRVDYRTLGVEPGERMENVLRIYARGPNGQERMFEYRENSLIDGALFRGWGNGEWGSGGWSGNWNGGGGDAGLFVILSAQYGSERRHVDVTRRLREMVRSDREFRVNFRAFGDDPDDDRPKVLRIYARGPNGRERMFEYRDGSVIDGAQFRGWRSGEWGDDHDHWSGRWEGEEREEHHEGEREQQQHR